MQGGKERQVGRNELSKTLKVTRDWGAAIACGCAVKMIDRFTKWKLPAREQKNCSVAAPRLVFLLRLAVG